MIAVCGQCSTPGWIVVERFQGLVVWSKDGKPNIVGRNHEFDREDLSHGAGENVSNCLGRADVPRLRHLGTLCREVETNRLIGLRRGCGRNRRYLARVTSGV